MLSDGKNTVQTKQWLDKCYLDSALSETMVKRWYSDFRHGCTDTNDAECPVYWFDEAGDCSRNELRDKTSPSLRSKCSTPGGKHLCWRHTWISNSWLVPYPEEKLGPPKGLIPLMAVLHQNKTKVRPVMDYWELNHHVDVFTANADVCTAKLCVWQDKRFYSMNLWLFNTIKIDGKR